MNNYFTNFNNLTEYNNFISSNDCPYVNVSYIGATDEVKYFKDTNVFENEYFRMPFTVEIVDIGREDLGTESETSTQLFIESTDYESFKYKVNNGQWVDVPSGTQYIRIYGLTVGDKVQIIQKKIRNDLNTPIFVYFGLYKDEPDSFDNIGGKLKIYGNILATTFGDEYLAAPVLPKFTGGNGDPGYYTRFFDDRAEIKEALVNAENLWLPTRDLPIFCFLSMFSGFTALKKGPDILAPEIPQWGCQHMFNGCSSLTDMPVIAATKMYAYACCEMFKDCSSLVNTTTLHVNTLYGSHTLEGMFHTCSSLTTTPQWSGDVLITEGKYGSPDRNNYFAGMFENCSSLTTANINIKLIYNFMEGEAGGMFYNFMSITNGGSGSLITAPVIEIERPDGSTAYDSSGNIYSEQTNLTEITYLSDDGNFNFGNLPDNGGTFYYKDGVSYDPAQYVPSSWTCEIYSE